MIQFWYDGIIQPQPGAIASAEMRNRVSWEMYEVIKISSGDDFYRKVQDAARLLNFNFVVFNSKEVSEKLQLLNLKLDLGKLLDPVTFCLVDIRLIDNPP